MGLIFSLKTLADACWFGVCVPGVGDNLATGAGVWAKVVQVANIVGTAAAVFCVVLVIWGGVQFITSAGDADKVESGAATIKNAIIGLIIIFLAGIIINAVIKVAQTGSL